MQEIEIAHLELFEHDDDEQLLGEVQRHPVGVFTRVIGAILLIAIIVTFGGLLENITLTGDPLNAFNSELNIIDYVPWVTTIFGVLIAVGTAASIYVYRNNYLVLTDQKLVFVRTHSLFSRSVSQLSIGDVQDATIEQTSLFSRMFNFGTIKVETAGEMDNFSFHYAKDPVLTAKHIVDAHEENLKLYGN